MGALFCVRAAYSLLRWFNPEKRGPLIIGICVIAFSIEVFNVVYFHQGELSHRSFHRCASWYRSGDYHEKISQSLGECLTVASEDAPLGIGGAKPLGPLRVKLRRTQCEHMFSGLPLKADIAQCRRHVSKVPEPDTHSLRNSFSLWRGSNNQPISSLPVTSRPIVVI